jgi:hypothetical protein
MKSDGVMIRTAAALCKIGPPGTIQKHKNVRDLEEVHARFPSFQFLMSQIQFLMFLMSQIQFLIPNFCFSL